MLVTKRIVPLFEMGALEVPDTKAVTPGLVHVGGTNAFEGAADFGLSLRGFRGRIEQTVGRQNEVGFATDGQTRGHVPPKATNASISFLKMMGSMTTPLPTTFNVSGRNTPLGMV